MLKGVAGRGLALVRAAAGVAMARARLARKVSKALGFARALRPLVSSVKVNQVTATPRQATKIAIAFMRIQASTNFTAPPARFRAAALVRFRLPLGSKTRVSI